jgi:hypothetical protein
VLGGSHHEYWLEKGSSMMAEPNYIIADHITGSAFLDRVQNVGLRSAGGFRQQRSLVSP